VYGQYADIQGDDALGLFCRKGMTLLDYFAGQAMCMWSDTEYMASAEQGAKECYDMAQAMIAEKEKRERGE
jgi:hypothetical protein